MFGVGTLVMAYRTEIGLVGLVVTAAVAVWKGVPRLLEVWLNHGNRFRSDLMDRVDKLETALADERRECDRKLSNMQERIDKLTKIVVDTLLMMNTGKAPEGVSAMLHNTYDPTVTVPPKDMLEQLDKIDERTQTNGRG